MFSSFFTVHADAPEEKEAKEEPSQEEEAEEEPAQEEEEEEEPEDVRIDRRTDLSALAAAYLRAWTALARYCGGVRAVGEVRACAAPLPALRGEGQRWRGLQGRGLRRGIVSTHLRLRMW